MGAREPSEKTSIGRAAACTASGVGAPAGPATRKRLGRDRVVELATARAAHAFAAHGLGAVSLRQVAREVGVDHALLHRYFGGREGLVKAAVRRAAEAAALQAAETDDPAEAMSLAFGVALREKDAVRVLARGLLDGIDMTDADARDNAAARAIELISERAGRPPGLDERAAVAAATAMVLGWILFEDFVMATTSLATDDREMVLREVDRIVRRLATAG